MKKNLVAIVISILLTLTSTASFSEGGSSRNGRPVPAWTPKKGFWIIESSLNNPREHTIYFYKDNKMMVYKERVHGYTIDVTKRKIKMRLKKLLGKKLKIYEKKQMCDKPFASVFKLDR
jgi:hypothetical protein